MLNKMVFEGTKKPRFFTGTDVLPGGILVVANR